MRRIVISGCSGGGKSTLLDELAARGHAVVGEPGRRVIAAERASGGTGLPWEDAARFADLAFWMAVADHGAAGAEITFFDRSALDQAAWYARQGTAPPGEVPRYDSTLFLAPPWPAIYAQDHDRRHGFEDAVDEYADLAVRLPDWGYQCHLLPMVSVAERADFVLATIGNEAAA